MGEGGTVGARRAAGGAGGSSGIPVWGSESESSSELEISSQSRAVPVVLDGLSLTWLPSASMYFIGFGPFSAFLRLRASGSIKLVSTCLLFSSPSNLR